MSLLFEDLKQGLEEAITFEKGIGEVPKPPEDIDASQMTAPQFNAKLQGGYDDYKVDRTQSAADAFAQFGESHS